MIGRRRAPERRGGTRAGVALAELLDNALLLGASEVLDGEVADLGREAPATEGRGYQWRGSAPTLDAYRARACKVKATVVHFMRMAPSKTTKPKGSKTATPSRTRSIGMSVRLSPEEHRDLQAVVKAWEEKGREQGYPIEGFGAWLRAIIHREKEALSSR